MRIQTIKKSLLLSGAIIGAATAAIGASMAKLLRKPAETDELPPGFVWIDGMDLDSEDDTPIFDVGDSVYLINPTTLGMWGGDATFEFPLVFEVLATKYDEQDAEWRYKIKPRDVSERIAAMSIDLDSEWIAESWLDIADKPSMYRNMPEKEAKVMAIDKEDVRKSGRYLEIDYWLDTLLHSCDVEERRQAEKRLAELIENNSEEEL